jgi:hypothetical protein
LSKSKTKNENKSAKEIWTRTTPSSGQIVRTRQRELVIMHGLVALFLGVIALAIILLVIGLRALQVLVVALRAIASQEAKVDLINFYFLRVVHTTSRSINNY